MTVEIALVISIISVSFSVFNIIKGNKRTDTKDIEERIAWNTKVDMKLDSINSHVQEIRTEMSTLSTKVDSLAERVAKVESSSKQAHKRIDSLIEDNK